MKRKLDGIKLLLYLTLFAVVLKQCHFAKTMNDMDGDSKLDLVADKVKEKTAKGIE